MNILNRILVILFALLVLVGAALVLVVAAGIVQPEQLGVPLLAEVVAPFGNLESPADLWTIVISAILVLLALVLLVAELTPPKRDEKLTVKEDELGRVTVSQNSLRKLANREAGQVPGVIEADSDVQDKREGIEVRSRVSVDPGSDVPALAEEVRERVKGAMERHLGRQVNQVAVSTQLEPLGGKKQRRVR